MKIRADLLRVSTNGMNADGSKAEPEQQVVQRVIRTEAPLTDRLTQKTVGSIPAEIVASSGTAQVMAQAVSSLCGSCRHFDNEEFVKTIAAADHPLANMEQRQAVNAIRAGLLQTQNAKLGEMHSGLDGDMDVEQAVKACGFCTALTEHYNEPIGVHPLSTCPAEVRTKESPLGFFQPKDRSAARIAGKNYDAVMNQAAGKLVSK